VFKDCIDLAERLRDLRPEEYESFRRNAAFVEEGLLLQKGAFSRAWACKGLAIESTFSVLAPRG
jgi:hypothetical protein